MKVSLKGVNNILKPLIPPFGVILIWAVIGAYWEPFLIAMRSTNPAIAAQLPDLSFLSTPMKVFVAWMKLLFDSGDLWRHAGATIIKTIGAVFLALTFGSALGFLIGRSKFWNSVLSPSIEALRTIPPVALLPFFILLFGVDWKFGIALGVFGTIWPVAISTVAAISSIPPEAIETGKNLRLTTWQLARYVEIPLSLPIWFTGVRITVSIAYILIIVSEMLAGYLSGLGASVEYAKQSFLFPQMFAYILSICLIGLGINLVLIKLEKHLLFWLPKHRK